MDKNFESNGDKTIIRLSGQLTSTDRKEFDDMVAEVFKAGAKEVEFNMAGLTYMDSVGLGMLVTLRDEAEKHDAVVELAEPQGNVKMLLEMARFDILFTIR